MSGIAKRFIQGLSDEQHIAALTTADPVLILAGAGSGKTRTLVGRFAHLVLPKEEGGLGADPSSIMMVTFTNKAAREMNERIQPMLEAIRESHPKVRGGSPWIGTFHGLSLRILRVESHRAGLGANFSILDDSDAVSLLRDLVDTQSLPHFDEDEFFSDLEYAKARLIGHELLTLRKQDYKQALEEGCELDAVQLRWKKTVEHFKTTHFAEVYSAYQGALAEQNAVDFSDLINRVTTLFRENPDIRRSWASTFRHFMVDEVQDINLGQLAWLQAMTDGGREMVIEAEEERNEHASATDGQHEVNGFRVRAFPRPSIAFVGDDDQSIYGFRGSEVGVLRGLPKRYPGLVTRVLKESYRCQPHILTVANTVVRKNTDRMGKTLEPANPGRAGARVAVERTYAAATEIEGIVRRARDHIAKGGKPGEFAVLLRTREMALFVARSLRESGLPVADGKASDIRKTAEVRDAMAFAGFLVNSDAETLLRRIINKPARGLGPTSVGLVAANARLKNISFTAELRSIMNDKIDLPETAQPYKKAFIASTKDFGRLVVGLRAKVQEAPDAGEAIRGILDATGYLPDLKKGALAASGFDMAPEHEAMAPREFLSWLMENSDEGKAEKRRMEAASKHDQKERARLKLPADDDIGGHEEDPHEALVDSAGRLSEKARQIGNLSLLIEQAACFPSLTAFMQEAMLEMNQTEAAPGVQVMTIHASKGLEFDHVTLPFWIEGVMPHARAENEGPQALEEERRLAYVAITRAREGVTISTSQNAMGVHAIRTRVMKESRFVKEVLEARASTELLKREKGGIVKPFFASRTPSAPRPAGNGWPQRPAQPAAAQPSAPRAPQPAPQGRGLADMIRSGLEKVAPETEPEPPF